jgi:hypothetical protein
MVASAAEDNILQIWQMVFVVLHLPLSSLSVYFFKDMSGDASLCFLCVYVLLLKAEHIYHDLDEENNDI